MLKVGAATETEMKEKKARVEDALHATRAAVEEGIVPGGGVALLRAQSALDGLEESLPEEQQAGVKIVRRAIEEPLRWIAGNAGIEGSIVVEKVKQGRGAFGFNAATEVYEDLVEGGVIDPTKVVRAALQNAASVASLLLTTEALDRGEAGEEGRRRARWAACPTWATWGCRPDRRRAAWERRRIPPRRPREGELTCGNVCATRCGASGDGRREVPASAGRPRRAPASGPKCARDSVRRKPIHAPEPTTP